MAASAQRRRAGGSCWSAPARLVQPTQGLDGESLAPRRGACKASSTCKQVHYAEFVMDYTDGAGQPGAAGAAEHSPHPLVYLDNAATAPMLPRPSRP